MRDAPSHPPPWLPRRVPSFGEFAVAGVLGIVLSAALVPRFIAARERSSVALAVGRMKSTAIAIESYFVDHEAFPSCGVAVGPAHEYDAQQPWQPRKPAAIPSGVATINSFAPPGSGAARLVTFRISASPPGAAHASDARLHCLTTPLAYLDRFHSDPFARTAGASFGYFDHGGGLGWILFSVGPDRDENDPNGPGDISPRVEHLYDLSSDFPYMWKPPAALISAGYDPTNGLFSDGDIYWLGGN